MEIRNFEVPFGQEAWRALFCDRLGCRFLFQLAMVLRTADEVIFTRNSDKHDNEIQLQFSKNLEKIGGNQQLCAPRSCLSREGDERMNAPPGVCSPPPPLPPAAGSSVLSGAWFVGRPTK